MDCGAGHRPVADLGGTDIEVSAVVVPA